MKSKTMMTSKSKRSGSEGGEEQDDEGRNDDENTSQREDASAVDAVEQSGLFRRGQGRRRGRG